MKKITLLSILVLSLLWSLPAAADITLPGIIGSNMVIQSDQPFRVWGWASPGENVSVSFNGFSGSTTADSQGKWEIITSSFASDSTAHQMTITGNNTINLTNILIGEVWLGSGQSNMVVNVRYADNHEVEESTANYPNIRLFKVDTNAAASPQDDIIVNTTWVECSPSSVPWFSAVAYFFGKEIHQATSLPVGLVQSCVGGTKIQSWMSHEALASLGKARGIQYESEYYNGMIHGIQKFSMRGVVWYQGESNAWPSATSGSTEYIEFLPPMIDNWRSGWQDNNLFFLIVQLPNYTPLQDSRVESNWANIRDAELQTWLDKSNTGMAITIDLGEADNIHPTNKQDVGHRLALNARALVYGESSLVYTGPIQTHTYLEGNAIRVHFNLFGGSLALLNPGDLTGFTVASPDKYWEWADAAIDGDTVVVHCDAVPNPTKMRYAWDDNPIYNLGNSDGIPASPFQVTSMTASIDDSDTNHKCKFTGADSLAYFLGLTLILTFKKKRS